MPRMSESTLKALLAAERADALAGMSQAKLSEDRSLAMDYYNMHMEREMPSLVGRSSAVSADVSDTIEGLMPSLMEVFCGSDDVVKFNPFGPEDIAAAEQETDYINHVFTQKNPGFLVLYSFIKDALLSKNGFVKVWWSEDSREDRETYFDLDDNQFMMLANDPQVEIVEHTIKDRPGEPEDEAETPSESGERDARPA